MKNLPLLAPLVMASCAAVTSPAPVTTLAVGPATFVPGGPLLAQDEPAPAVAKVADAPANRLTIYLGRRSLDDDDFWTPVEDQAVFAVEFAHEPEGSSIGWEIGLAGSADDANVAGINVEGTTGELYGGVVKSFQSPGSKLRPYIGGGLSYITAEVEALGASVDDSSIAAYVHGGAAVHLTEALFLGVDLRLLFGSDITLPGFVDSDVDYRQLAVFLGFGF